MAETIQKPVVTLGGVPLAATSPILWQFVRGTQPYTTTMTVHRSAWNQLSTLIGKPTTLKIQGSSGLEIKNVFILHTAPSDSPNRVSFKVADKRWRWRYQLMVRDYNVPRKTGDRTAHYAKVPIETGKVTDRYDYLPYSLAGGEIKWTPQEALRDIMREAESITPTNPAGGYRFEPFPIREGKAGSGISLENVMLRDSVDVALDRMMSYIPGVDVYVNAEGMVVFFDGTDLDGTKQYFQNLPVATWSGDSATIINRQAIRPSKIHIYYQREVEAVFDFGDDYGSTMANPNRDTAYLENVLPTVDPTTTLSEYDPVSNQVSTKNNVPPGTWVRVDRWLTAMDSSKPSISLPWTWDTIKYHWVDSDLETALGGQDKLDDVQNANVGARVHALIQHFRQTFRLNRRYMERISALKNYRVALLDPVTGARAPSAVWGEYCYVPSDKGLRFCALSGDPQKQNVWLNVDGLVEHNRGARLIDTTASPAAVQMVDPEIGVFRVNWLMSPYGTKSKLYPFQVGNPPKNAGTRDFAKQTTAVMGAGMKVTGGSNALEVHNTFDMKVMMTLVPAAPNNKTKFHRVEVDPDDISKQFKRTFHINQGKGPVLEVFVPPTEATARYAWQDDDVAEQTLKELLGLIDPDPKQSGVKANELAGYVLVNEDRYLTDHALALAAELMTPFADSVQGTITTGYPTKDDVKLVGNMASSTVRVGKAPSAKLDVAWTFPGTAPKVSRFALMGSSTRAIVLGIVKPEA